MATGHGEERPTNFRLDVPPELAGGIYANFLAVWHTRHEFTLDFASTGPPEIPDDATAAIDIPCRVVTRVKVPRTVMFDMLRAMSDNLARYEDEYETVHRPEASDE